MRSYFKWKPQFIVNVKSLCDDIETHFLFCVLMTNGDYMRVRRFHNLTRFNCAVKV